MYYDTDMLTPNGLSRVPIVKESGILMRGVDEAEFRLSPQIHTAYIGSTGAGKTTAMRQMARPMYLDMTQRQTGCHVYFDPKDDFSRALVGPRDVVLGRTDHWNLLEEMMYGFTEETPFETVFERAAELSALLFAPRLRPGICGEQYFPKAASSVLAGLLAVQTMEALEDPGLAGSLNNATLKDEINRATPQRLLQRMAPYPQLESIRYHLSTSGGELSSEGNGVISELTLMIRETFAGDYARPGHFSVRRFLAEKNGNALFLPFDPSMARSQGACCRAIVDLALQLSLAPGGNPGATVFFLEELPLISDPPLSNLSCALNLGRGAGVSLFCAAQSVAQLHYLYGQAQAEAILGGFGQKLFFAANDAAGAEYVRRQFGQAQRAEYHFNAHGERVCLQRLGNAVESWDLASLQLGEAIVGLGSLPAFRFHFAGENL